MPDRPTDAQLARIKQGLSRCSRTVVEQFLRYSKLPAGTGDTKAEIDKRVVKYIQDGRLTLGAVARAIVEFQEFSNKAVFLYTVEPKYLKGIAERLQKRVDDWTHASIIAAPSSPVVSYSLIDDDVVHVSFVEPHQKARVDYEAGRIVTTEVTKVVVLEVERATGFVTIRFDPPEVLTPHSGGRLGYYRHYIDRAEGILKGPLTRYDISAALLALDASNLVRTPYGTARMGDGDLALTAQADYRTMGVYPAIAPEIAVKVKGRYIWLRATAVADALLRDVPTDINAAVSLVRFTKDVVSPEVAYVLGQVRAHA